MGRECRYQGAIVDGRRLLLVQHRNVASGHVYWVPPGGGMEPGESDEECVKREVLEETYLHVDIVRVLFVVDHAEPRPYRQSRTFLCSVVGGVPCPGIEPEHDEDATYVIDDVGWFSLDDEMSWPVEVATDTRTVAFIRSVRSALGVPPPRSGAAD